MLDKIEKYAPKTHAIVLKIITTKQNAEKKIEDYKQRIQQFDNEIAVLEVKSIKDPNNLSINEKLEELSAKRFGLFSRYESIKNNELNLFSKAEIDKLFEVYAKEFKDKVSVRHNEVVHQYQILSEENNKKRQVLQDEYVAKRSLLQSEEYALQDITEVLGQTLTKYLLMNNMNIKEVEKLMLENGLPFDGKIDRSL